MKPPALFCRVALLLATSLFCYNTTFADEHKPNIIFVLADDLGWAELGCYGNTFHETPHLDNLAEEGLRFTQAYAAAPVCSPYRAALLTGQTPARLGITDYLRPNSANALSEAQVTLPEMLGRNGYATGMVGKWHLTGYKFQEAEFELRPMDHGFAWNTGSEVKGVGNGANTWPYVFREQPIRWIDLPGNRLGEEEYLTDRLNLEAVEFIERNQDTPFFLYLSHYAPHTILNGRSDLVEKYRKKHAPGASGRPNCYICEDAGLGKGDPGNHWATHHNPHLAGMLESIDDGIGLISAKLEELGIADNTIVIFSSDNGGETNITSNAPLRGGKSQLYEGGIRVPLIVRWPERIAPGGFTEVTTVNTDFYPTLLAAAEVDPDPSHKLDGISTLQTWEDPQAEPEREFLAWHYPLDRPHFLGGVSGGAIRSGDWKLIEHFDSGEDELFALASDPSEATNVASENADVVDRLKRSLSEWREDVGARMPSAPFLTETRNLYFGDHFKPGLVSDRLWYTKDWVAEDGILKRLPTGSENTRIFLRDAEYKNVVVQFDFRLGQAKDVRLMTGSGGGYNAVVHLRPDHFFIQTAVDRSVPYFSYRHGECAYAFEPDRWYTMTVEFVDDEVIAHLDADHVAHARHPIIDRTRQYFAFQVDENEAAFDNIQIFTAVAKKRDVEEAGRARLEAAIGNHPVQKSLEEEIRIEKVNAHERLYQNDETYRGLVNRVDQLDDQNKELFPAVNWSHKDYRKKVSQMRRKLHDSDPVYKETLFATHRANRALDAFLIAQKPEVEDWPNNRKKAELERLRLRFGDDPRYRKLIEEADAAQAKLEADYPMLFVSDEEIHELKKAAQEEAKSDSAFVAAKNERGAAYRAQQDYLHQNDERLSELMSQLEGAL
ncbi:MAG: sulfatase-like hydrolase/transferase [Verrucomicrobiota bacterium]